MGRSTQFIGLTPDAKRFVADLKEVPSNRHTVGMFGEPVPLRSWRTQNGNRIHEVVQATPWSSGPMILTCLAFDWYGEDPGAPIFDTVNADIDTACLAWLQDPTMEFGLDYDKGKFFL